MSERIVYLMRGLPSCGKSHTARRLAGETGVICETDEYFYTQVGKDPTKFNWREELLPEARQWNFERFQHAVCQNAHPIVVDRGNGLNAETQRYARFAIDHGYHVELAEPESPWWQEIRAALKGAQTDPQALDLWPMRLSRMSRATHRVPAATIRHWMQSWRPNLTVDQILAWAPRNGR
jgi:hypothetical protein